MAFPGYGKPDPFMIDAGVVYEGSTPLLKGTRGGLVFDPGIERRHPEFDGKTSDIAGLHRNLRYMPRITGKVLDISAASLGKYEPGSASDGSSGTNEFTMLDATVFIDEGDYLTTVRYIGRCSDGKTREVVFERALVEKYTLTSEPDSESVFDVSILAVLDESETNINKCPYVWREVDA